MPGFAVVRRCCREVPGHSRRHVSMFPVGTGPFSMPYRQICRSCQVIFHGACVDRPRGRSIRHLAIDDRPMSRLICAEPLARPMWWRTTWGGVKPGVTRVGGGYRTSQLLERFQGVGSASGAAAASGTGAASVSGAAAASASASASESASASASGAGPCPAMHLYRPCSATSRSSSLARRSNGKGSWRPAQARLMAPLSSLMPNL